jgi:hypothetical protein
LNEYSRRFEIFFKPDDFKKVFSLNEGINFDDVEIITRKLKEEIS